MVATLSRRRTEGPTVSDTDPDALPVLKVSDSALAQVLDLRSGEDRADSLALWVEVAAAPDGTFAYEIYFQATGDARTQDWSHSQEGLALVVPEESVPMLRGSVLDLVDGGLVIENPNPPPPPVASPAMGAPPADLSGDVAQRILQVLEQQINPSIAAHGGRADLVAVEDDAAYLRLSGGCAGCGMATVTLSQGIEVVLRESVPEITQVIDVTDHAAGANPYYEAAKK